MMNFPRYCPICHEKYLQLAIGVYACYLCDMIDRMPVYTETRDAS